MENMKTWDGMPLLDPAQKGTFPYEIHKGFTYADLDEGRRVAVTWDSASSGASCYEIVVWDEGHPKQAERVRSRKEVLDKIQHLAGRELIWH